MPLPNGFVPDAPEGFIPDAPDLSAPPKSNIPVTPAAPVVPPVAAAPSPTWEITGNKAANHPVGGTNIPTMSGGEGVPIPTAPQMEATHAEANGEVPLVPGFGESSPNGMRAALGSATLNTAPYAASALQAGNWQEFKDRLKVLQPRYMKAQEEHPGMATVGGLAGGVALPFSKVGYLGQVGVGAGAGAIAGFLGSDLNASVKERAQNTAVGAAGSAAGAAILGAVLHPSAAPREPAILSPELTENFIQSLNEVPPPLGGELRAAPLKGMKGPAETPKMSPFEVIQKLETDPASVPSTRVTTPAAMKATAASVHFNEDGVPTGAIYEVNGDGVAQYIHPAPITTVDDAYRFKQLLVKYHPDVPYSVDPEIWLRADDAMQRALYPTAREARGMNLSDLRPERQVPVGAETNAGPGRIRRTPTPRDEAPLSRPGSEPALVNYDESAGLEIHKLESPSAKIASLQNRAIRAIDTPQGVRYAREVGGHEKGFTLLTPFDAEEGIPTIARVSRVANDSIRVPEAGELNKVVNASQPKAEVDVHVDPAPGSSFSRDAVQEGKVAAYNQNRDSGPKAYRYGKEGEVSPTNASAGLFYSVGKPLEGYNSLGRSLKEIAPNAQRPFVVPGRVTYPGEHALQTLDPATWNAVKNLSHEELANYILEKWPGMDLSNYSSTTHQLLETIGAQVARARGYDAIIANKGTEFVALKSSAIGPSGEGGGNGLPPPPPGPEPMPPPPPPGPPPPSGAASDEMLGKLTKQASTWDKLRRQFVGAHLRSPLDFASFVSDQQSLKNLEKGWVATNNALERRLGSAAKANDFKEGVLSYLKRDITEQQLAEQHPEAWTKMRDMIGDAVAMRDSNQKWLVEHGYVPDETFSQSEGDMFKAYVTREYAAHNLPPGKWLKIIEKDKAVWDRAIKGYQEWSGGTKDAITAEADIRAALGTEDPGGALFSKNNAVKGGVSATQKLGYRKDLPDWYRNLLGENRDGFLAISKTLATQDALINNFKIWEGLASNPAWVAPKAMAADWVQLPDNPRQFGKASGMYASPDVYDALVTLPNIKHQTDPILGAILGYVKTNQVSLGSFRTFLNMTVDNLAGGVLSGGVDLTRPIATGRGIKYAAKAMSEFRKNPLAQNEWAQFIRDARRIGTDAPGHIGADVTSLQKRQAADAMMQIAGVKEDSFPNILAKMAELHQRAGAKGSVIVDGIDRVQKLASWKIVSDGLMEKGMPREDALRKAARSIFQSYAMYDRTAPIAERLSNSYMGVAAPYSKFAMERNRIWGSIPGRILSNEDPGLKFRLLKWAAVGTALFGAQNGVRGYLGQVSKEDVDADMQNRAGTLAEKGSPNVCQWVAPVRINGKVVNMDMTQWFAPCNYLMGDQSAGPLANIAINIARGPLQGGAAGEVLDTGLQSLGINQGFETKPPMPGTNPLVSAGEAAMRAGAVPRLPLDLFNSATKAGLIGNQGSKKEAMSPGLGMARMAGAPVGDVQSVGIPGAKNPAMLNKAMQEKKQIADAVGVLRWAAAQPPDKAQGPLQTIVDVLSGSSDPQAHRTMDAAIKLIKAHADELAKTGKLNRAAVQSHQQEK